MSNLFQVRNDHTYVQRPREAGLEDDDLDSVDPNPAAESNAGPAGSTAGSASNLLGSHNMDIVLLSRHIAHMQRICRTSLQVRQHSYNNTNCCIFFFVVVVGQPHEDAPIEGHPGNLTMLMSKHLNSSSIAF